MLRTCGDYVEDKLILAQRSINFLSTSSPTNTSVPAPMSGHLFVAKSETLASDHISVPQCHTHNPKGSDVDWSPHLKYPRL